MTLSHNQPGVTWLLPVKNGMPFLPRTLQSIAEQTYSNHRVIAWDNGSTDGTCDVLRQWIGPRIAGEVITDRPMGLGASLAAMVEAARTPYCARIDADDVNEPDRLVMQVAFMQANPHVAAVGSNTQWIDRDDQLIAGAAKVALHDADIRWRLRFYNAFNHPTMMLRRSAVLDAGNYRDVMPIEDYDLWLRLALGGALANLETPLVRYRVLSSSISATHQPHIDGIREGTILAYAAELFPGLPPHDAQRLLDCITAPEQAGITYSDIRRLQRAATNAALAAGESADYFRNTDLYTRQLHDLRVRWMKAQPGITPIWNAAKRLRTRRATNEHAQAQVQVQVQAPHDRNIVTGEAA